MQRQHLHLLPSVVCFYLLFAAVVPGQAQYTDWSPPVNLGAVVNSPDIDETPFLSRDGLSLYFSSTRPGGFGGSDIWVTKRSSIGAPWGEPANLGPGVNTADHESHPTLSVDGHTLYFDRMPIGPGGTYDMFSSRRRHKGNEQGWETAVNVGPCINTAANDSAMIFFEDERTGITYSYFNSNRTGNPDFYLAVFNPEGLCTLLGSVTELNTPFVERNATIRHDGLEILFESTRPGSIGFDVWTATRNTLFDPWTNFRNVDSINSPFYDGRPALSWDATELYFFSDRGGNFDLYVSRREKLKVD